VAVAVVWRPVNQSSGVRLVRVWPT
jgi:hypothetical protein